MCAVDWWIISVGLVCTMWSGWVGWKRSLIRSRLSLCYVSWGDVNKWLGFFFLVRGFFVLRPSGESRNFCAEMLLQQQSKGFFHAPATSAMRCDRILFFLSFFVLAFWFICMFIGEFKKKVWKTKLENQNQKRWLIVTQIPFLYVSPPVESCHHFSGRSVAGIRNSHHVVTRWIFFLNFTIIIWPVCVCVHTEKKIKKRTFHSRLFNIYFPPQKEKKKINLCWHRKQVKVFLLSLLPTNMDVDIA
jgi:hypothetical protein